MSFSSRFSAIVLLLGLGFAGAWLIGAYHQQSRLDQLARETVGERKRILGRWLGAVNRPLDQFAYDYSYWSDMVDFLRTRDPAFRADNLEYLIDQVSGVDFVWVYSLDWEPVLVLARGELGADPLGPWLPSLRRTEAKPTAELRFHVEHRGLPLRVVGFPIQRNDVPRDEARPEGWLLLGRSWDREFLDGLGEVVGGEASFHDAREPHVHAEEARFDEIVHRRLDGPQGIPTFHLEVDLDLASLEAFRRFTRSQALIVIGFVVVLFVVLTTYVYLMFLRPVNVIAQRLLGRQTARPELGLARSPELDALVAATEEFLDQRRRLSDEVERRRQAEISLRFRERDLKVVLERHESLARDLHDGSIQSLYALGLHVESILRRLGRPGVDPAAETPGLDAIRSGINRVIADLRNFIRGSGPESLRGLGFAEAVDDLVAENREATAVDLVAAIDPGIAARLGSGLTRHLFFITHELVSNALRHGEPRRVRIALEPSPAGEGRALLRVTNDGRPFVLPESATGGWRNLRSRAESIAARLELVQHGEWLGVELDFPLATDEPDPDSDST